ncbi:MAG TPA: RNA-binding domain-containing protein [Gammaproteobacteria bacterium]|jgi:ATP-dependent DNA helicase RecG|nr:RNA-binding domain-containing protein [Gammaproteobacteria bacterium]
MDIDKVKFLASQLESQRLEFKKSTANLKDIFQTICAFLNGDGGAVLIGVDDNGNLMGQEVSDKTKREIGIEIAKISPFSDSTIEVFYVHLIGNRQIIAFHITTDSTRRPYTYSGRAYIRIQSDTLLMPPDHYQQLLVNNGQFHDRWEDQSLLNATIHDLDHDEIVSTIKEGVLNGRIPEGYETKDPNKALAHLGLMNADQVTRAAFILFSKKPERIFPQCMLRLARFKGTEKSEFIDNKQVYGNVFHLLRSALAFANSHLSIASTFSKDSIKREDKPLFPIPVLREAIINALCHRDYSYTGGSISLAIYNDRLEIWSYGLLPPGLSIEDLGQLNQSIPRNRRIANVLYYHKLFESWGRGIRLIIDGCLATGHPAPIYSINSGGLLLTMPYELEMDKKLPDETRETLTPQQKEVLSIMESVDSVSSSELRDRLSFSPSERWVRDTLNKLKKNGYIGVVGETTARKWFLIQK